jgi:hypothetical protein
MDGRTSPVARRGKMRHFYAHGVKYIVQDNWDEHESMKEFPRWQKVHRKETNAAVTDVKNSYTEVLILRKEEIETLYKFMNGDPREEAYRLMNERQAIVQENDKLKAEIEKFKSAYPWLAVDGRKGEPQ